MNKSRLRRLELLGSVHLLNADGNPLDTIITQPKRLAVLAYLAIARGPVRRDTLLALGWPESTDSEARNALNQTLHFLRRHLGRASIISRGVQEVELSTEELTVDVHDFLAASEQEHWDEACRLYRGELLAGLHVADARDLSDWMDSERTRLRREALRSATALARTLHELGGSHAAEMAARRALEIEPTSETAARLLIEILLAAGSVVPALEAFEMFRQHLVEAYDLEPSDELVRFVDTHVHRDRPARELGAESSFLPETSRAVYSAKRHLIRWRQLGRPAVIAMAPIVGAAVLALLMFSDPPERNSARELEARPALNRLAVLYFDHTPEDSTGYLADALTESLIDQLSTVSAIAVVPSAAVRPFRRREIMLDSVAEQFRVGTLITGDVENKGDRIELRVRLIDAASQTLEKIITIHAPADDPFSLIEQMSARIAGALRQHLGQALALDRWRSGTTNQEAWELTARSREIDRTGRSFFSAGRLKEAERLLMQADSLLQRAAALDKRWAAPVLLRARITEASALLCITDPSCESSTATERFERAIKLANQALKRSPDDAEALAERGRFRYLLVAVSPGSRSEQLLTAAEGDLREAIRRDPYMAEAWTRLSAIQYGQGSFEDARLSARKAYEANSFLNNIVETLGDLFATNLHLGDYEQAARWCAEVQRESPGRWPAAFCRLNLMAYGPEPPPDAGEVWAVLEQNVRVDPTGAAMLPRLEMLAAVVLARAGYSDSAHAVIVRAAGRGTGDPDLRLFEAAARLAVGDTDSASALLEAHIAENPAGRSGVRKWRWFRDLHGASMSAVDPEVSH